MTTSSRRLVGISVAIILSATVLRAPFVAVAPVVGSIRSDLAITATIAGLLTSIPVLCFALATPLAVWIVRRASTTFALSLCLAGTTAAMIVRSLGGLELALIGTALIGVFLTIGNVVVPVIIRREYSAGRAGFMTGVYISAINIGSMIATLGTAPLEPSLGWRGALLVWSGFAIAALAVWIGLNGWRRALVPQSTDAPVRDELHVPTSVFRSLTVWLLAAAFAGQAFSYYGVTAWLPQLLVDDLGYSRTASGAISSIFQVAAIIGALGAPLIARRFGAMPAIAVLTILWLTVPLGFLFAPSMWFLWCVLGGAAQGGGLTIVLIIASRLGRDDHHAAAVNALVQGVGYAVAAVAPALIGGLHDLTGAWVLPLCVVLVAIGCYGTLGSIAAVRARNREPVVRSAQADRPTRPGATFSE